MNSKWYEIRKNRLCGVKLSWTLFRAVLFVSLIFSAVLGFA